MDDGLERRQAYRSDIDEIKSDSRMTLRLVQEIITRLAVGDTKQLTLEGKVRQLDQALFGNGTDENPGHISKTNARIGTLENTQKSYSRVIWTVVTPILSLLGIGIIILLVLALAAK